MVVCGKDLGVIQKRQMGVLCDPDDGIKKE